MFFDSDRETVLPCSLGKEDPPCLDKEVLLIVAAPCKGSDAPSSDQKLRP